MSGSGLGHCRQTPEYYLHYKVLAGCDKPCERAERKACQGCRQQPWTWAGPESAWASVAFPCCDPVARDYPYGYRLWVRREWSEAPDWVVAEWLRHNGMDGVALVSDERPLRLPVMAAYKLIRVRRNGTLAPLFINRRQVIPVGVWLPAENHPTKGYALRPGWHVTAKPVAPHLSLKGRKWVRVLTVDRTELQRPESQGGLWYLARWMKVLGDCPPFFSE